MAHAGVGSNAFNFGLMLNSILGIKPTWSPLMARGVSRMPCSACHDIVVQYSAGAGHPAVIPSVSVRRLAAGGGLGATGPKDRPLVTPLMLCTIPWFRGRAAAPSERERPALRR